MQKDKKKIILTGGHAATSALATVEEISKRQKNWKLYWVGPISAMETQKVSTAAEKTLHEYGVIIKKIIAGRALKKGGFLARLKAYIKIPFGFIHAFFEVFLISPDLVLSFGGFAALPVVFSSWAIGKPVIIHEQTTGAGLANNLSIPFAKKIAVARKESLEFFPKEKTIVIGNPQVSSFFKISPKFKIGNPPVIFVTGGSSGSKIINDIVTKVLDKLLFNNIVIHQTGENNQNDFSPRKNYEVFGYLKPGEFVKFFERADLIISRAGANTVSDIVASKRPAILIPIPWSIGDEQRKNAQKAQKTGLVEILSEDELSAENLLKKIEKIKANWEKIVKNADTSDYEIDRGASKKLVDIIEETL